MPILPFAYPKLPELVTTPDPMSTIKDGGAHWEDRPMPSYKKVYGPTVDSPGMTVETLVNPNTMQPFESPATAPQLLKPLSVVMAEKIQQDGVFRDIPSYMSEVTQKAYALAQSQGIDPASPEGIQWMKQVREQAQADAMSYVRPPMPKGQFIETAYGMFDAVDGKFVPFPEPEIKAPQIPEGEAVTGIDSDIQRARNDSMFASTPRGKAALAEHERRVKEKDLENEGSRSEYVRDNEGNITLKRIKPGESADGIVSKDRLEATEKERDGMKLILANKNALTDLAKEHQQLYSKGMAGPSGVLWQKAKGLVGAKDAEYRKAETSLFAKAYDLARGLNGVGVLSNQDFSKMEEKIPSLYENPQSFAGGVQGLAQYLYEKSLASFEVSKNRIPKKQREVVEQALNDLKSIVGNPNGSPASQDSQVKTYASPEEAEADVSLKSGDIVIIAGKKHRKN